MQLERTKSEAVLTKDSAKLAALLDQRTENWRLKQINIFREKVEKAIKLKAVKRGKLNEKIKAAKAYGGPFQEASDVENFSQQELNEQKKVKILKAEIGIKKASAINQGITATTKIFGVNKKTSSQLSESLKKIISNYHLN